MTLNWRQGLIYTAILLIGFLLGGYLFAKSQPRSFLALPDCQTTCLNANELIGLLASVGIQNFGSVLPLKVKETDKVVVIKHPFPDYPIHYLAIPKRDFKNIADVGADDWLYVTESISLLTDIVREQNLSNYRIITNGPGYQQVTYLHFHLVSRDVR